jgi:hypothetical protein
MENMSDKLLVAFEKFPNLASRALVMLMQDSEIAAKIEEWIKEQASMDVRFLRLAKLAGIEHSEWVELPRCGCGA